MRNTKPVPRSRLLRRARQFLERRSIARVQMSVMVCLTGVAGFLVSVVLLRLGLTTMWIRYGLAAIGAYLVFLALVWLWILYYRGRVDLELDPLDALDALDAAEAISSLLPSDPQIPGVSSVRLPAESPAAGPGSGFSFGLEADEWFVLLALVAAVGSALVAAVYLISTAPVLLGEVLVDGVLSVGLYRRLRKVDQRHWLESAVLRTRFPVFWVALFFVVAGAAMHVYAPEAVSIGGVWHHYVATLT